MLIESSECRTPELYSRATMAAKRLSLQLMAGAVTSGQPFTPTYYYPSSRSRAYRR
jgi:hypothetical protein